MENWLPFFLNEDEPLLNQRDVYLLYPRNFGNSDHCDYYHPQDYHEHLVGDVERFMYQNKIGSATLGGHGLGAKNALLFSCLKPTYTTGFFGLDFSPQDYKHHRFAESTRDMLNNLSKIDFSKSSRSEINEVLRQHVQSPKILHTLMEKLRYSKDKGYHFDFNLKFINENYDNLVDWQTTYGCFGGRSTFIFPSNSSHVHLGTNTIPMYKTCIHLQGYSKDIIEILTEDDNEEQNHWIYEDKELLENTLFALSQFLSQKDGVHLLQKNRQDMLNETAVPGIVRERKDGKGQFVPQYTHHNWRFNSQEAEN